MPHDSNDIDVLVIEDTYALATVYEEFLLSSGYTVRTADCAAAGLGLMQRRPKLVILDLNLPDMDGFDVLRRMMAYGYGEIPVVVITTHGAVTRAVEAIRLGACDFLIKPVARERLLGTVARTLAASEQTANENRKATAPVIRTASDIFYGFTGSSPALATLHDNLEIAARSSAPVFITGEKGTGKQACAEIIHRGSDRADHPFIPIDCRKIPEDLIDAELMGHASGAVSGALSDRLGAVQLADGGTIFINEICAMDLSTQGALMTFLRTGLAQPIGGGLSDPIDVRVMCSTSRDPMREVAAGRLREDLFYRLHILPVHLPALRDREDDVVTIARHILERLAADRNRRFAGFSADAEEALRRYPWPGNLRELETCMNELPALPEGGQVTATTLNLRNEATDMHDTDQAIQKAFDGDEEDKILRPSFRRTPGNRDIVSINLNNPLWVIEKEIIEATIHACNGSIPKAAKRLRISPSTIYRKKESWADRAARKRAGLPCDTAG